MVDIDPKHLALFVAAHAVAETRFGLPYERIDITSTPHWSEPERPLTWKTKAEESELRTRLSVGFGVLHRTDVDANAAMEVCCQDLNGLCDIEELTARIRPSVHAMAKQAKETTTTFLNDATNARAIELVAQQLIQRGSLDIHEVDFLVEAADGDSEALDGLERYRCTFSSTQIPWPDHT